MGNHEPPQNAIGTPIGSPIDIGTEAEERVQSIPRPKSGQKDALALTRNNGRMPPNWPPNPLATEGRLSGFVCRRLQFGQVHREVEHDLDWFSVRMGIVIAINVHLHLPAVANDSAPSMLK